MDNNMFADLLTSFEIHEYREKFEFESTTTEDMVQVIFLILNQSGLPMVSLTSDSAPDNNIYIELQNGTKYQIHVKETDKKI